VQGLSAATTLTSLDLRCHVGSYIGWNMPYLHPVCSHLASLTRLSQLSLQATTEMPAADCMALTALTSLTRLRLSGLEAAVGDSTAVALACCLKQLRHLELERCSLGYFACTAAIAQLRGLLHLR
jgi:hypothetical protein